MPLERAPTKREKREEKILESLFERTGCHEKPLRLLAKTTGLQFFDLVMAFAIVRHDTIAEAALAAETSANNLTLYGDLMVDRLSEKFDKVVSYKSGAVSDNPTIELSGRQTIGSVFMIPVSLPAQQPNNYDPNFKDYVAKFLVSVAHNGYVMSVNGPYTGSSEDQVAAEHCGFFENFSKAYPDASLLADGEFSAPNALVSPTQKEVAEDAADTEKANAKLCSRNFRSRIGQRFTKISSGKWTRSASTLDGYIKMIFMYLNVENYCNLQKNCQTHESPSIAPKRHREEDGDAVNTVCD